MKPGPLLFLLVTSLMHTGCSSQPYGYADNVRYCYPNSDSIQNCSDKLNTDYRGHFSVSTSFELDSGMMDQIKDFGLQIFAEASYEMFWDGIYLGSNGSIDENEIPGSVTETFLIPDSLSTNGSHKIELLCSNTYASGIVENTVFTFSNYEGLLTSNLKLTAFVNMLSGVFLVVGIYYLFLYFTGFKESLILIFSLLNIAFFFLVEIEYIKFIWHYDYSLHFERLMIIKWLTITISLMVVLFLIQFFNTPRKYLLLVSTIIMQLVAAFILSNQFDLHAQISSLIMFVFSLGITIYGVMSGRKNSTLILASILLSAMIILWLPYDMSLFISFGFLIISILYTLAIRIKDQRQSYIESTSRSLRLETDLLKMSIQPHFLMNTLTSLIDWVEESPKEGVKLIQELANEFKILLSISGKKKIAIMEEIALCKSHLTVMKYRKEVNYVWKEYNIDNSEEIPPAVLHTMVENGVTHCSPTERQSVIFELKFSRTKNHRVYELKTIGKVIETTLGKNQGIGNRYIEARLKESYQNNWIHTSTQIAEGWLARIEFVVT